MTALEEFTPDWYHTRAGVTPLHYAAEMGFRILAKRMLMLGYTNHLWVKGIFGMYPVEVAVLWEHFDTAEVILKSMTTYRLIFIFIYSY